MSIRRIVLGIAGLLGLGSPVRLHAQETRFEFAQVHMGMEVRVVLYATEAGSARAAAAAAFERIRKLEDTMSDYREESEIRRLALRPEVLTPVSPELFAVLTDAVRLAERSGGAFDPTVGPVVELWRAARRTGERPTSDSLRSALGRVGWRLVQLDSATRAVRLLVPGVRLDLGGIAKGFILDQALAAIRASGITRALLVAGGDIVAGDAPPETAGWAIAVDGASAAMKERAAALANSALAASGDSEQFFVLDGVRYSHVVDPRTGQPLTDRRRAYVIARSGSTADGLATALTVVDSAERGRLLAWYPDAFGEVIP